MYVFVDVFLSTCLSAGRGGERAEEASGTDVVGETGAGGAAGRGDKGETLTSDIPSQIEQVLLIHINFKY